MMNQPDTKTPSKAAGRPETPRTDAVTVVPWTDGRMRKNDGSVDRVQDTENFYVPADFACELETELAETNKHLAVTARNSLLFMQERNDLQANLTTAARRIAELETQLANRDVHDAYVKAEVTQLKAHAERMAGALEKTVHFCDLKSARDQATEALALYRAAKETK